MDFDDIEIRAIPNSQLDAVMPIVFGLISSGLEHANDELSANNIKDDLYDNAKALLCIFKDDKIIGAVVLQVMQYDSGARKLGVVTAAGKDMESWVDKLDRTLVSIAIDCNCSELKIIGREGWAKLLKDRGWSKLYVVLSKTVGG